MPVSSSRSSELSAYASAGVIIVPPVPDVPVLPVPGFTMPEPLMFVLLLPVPGFTMPEPLIFVPLLPFPGLAGEPDFWTSTLADALCPESA